MSQITEQAKKESYMIGLTGKHTRNRKENCYAAFKKRVDKRRKAK